MPTLDQMTESEDFSTGAHTYSGAGLDDLGAVEYTLVTLAVDTSGSVRDYSDQLRQALETALEACSASARSENLLVRIVSFSSGVDELVGFSPLSRHEKSQLPDLRCGGMTALNDAAFNAVDATVDYGTRLHRGDFLANAVVYVITDGVENHSSSTAGQVKDRISQAISGEELQSLEVVVIGIGPDASEQTKEELGADAYVHVADASDSKLAKMARFISQSISSSSQSLGTGGTSASSTPDSLQL